MSGGNERKFSKEMKGRKVLQSLRLAGAAYVCLLSGVLCAQVVAPVAAKAASEGHAAALLPSTEIAATVPPSVFFHGKLAPVQVRNSGAMRWADGSLSWAAMVDTSGYASDVQEVYQFYFVTERPVKIGGKLLPAGAYGAGVVNGKLGVLDIGGHALFNVPAEADASMQRPRPLQMVVAGMDAVRLYLGKRWVLVQVTQ